MIELQLTTNRNLAQQATKDRFRGDYFQRSDIFPIRVPALRDRAEDISSFIEHVMAKLRRRLGQADQRSHPEFSSWKMEIVKRGMKSCSW